MVGQLHLSLLGKFQSKIRISNFIIFHEKIDSISFTTLNKRFLWIQRDKFIGKRILEIGCGTALPGILAAKFGAKVILSDSCTFPNALKHASRCCSENNLEPGRDIDVIGLTWGLLLKSVFNIGPLDYIIASDCFYDPSVFEDILVTVSFLLNATSTSQNSAPVKFLFTYQERSSDWSIDHLLQKWRLRCSKVSLKCVKKLCPIDLNELMNNHTIHLLEISKLS